MRREAFLLLRLLRGSYFSILLVCVPLGLIAGLMQWGPLPEFFLVRCGKGPRGCSSGGPADPTGQQDSSQRLLCPLSSATTTTEPCGMKTPLPSSLLCGGPLFPQACFPCSLPQNLVALIPLALLLGDITEDLAEHFGDVVGGLLNATFGNVRRLSQSHAAA